MATGMQMRTWTAGLILVVAFLPLGACSAQVLHPLARVKIHANGRIGDFDKMVDEFAAAQGFVVARGNFQRGDRWVDNIKIDADASDQIFISLVNFRDANVLEGAIYSQGRNANGGVCGKVS